MTPELLAEQFNEYRELANCKELTEGECEDCAQEAKLGKKENQTHERRWQIGTRAYCRNCALPRLKARRAA